MARKVQGTEKFIIYLYNGKMVRGGNSKPKEYVYRQWGRILKLDENNKPTGKDCPFTDYGEMITFINKKMRKKLMKNLKEKKTW